MILLLAAGAPWALLMPWLISSPLNSPNTFFLIAGALGYPMAIAQMVAAVSLGIVSGIVTDLMERNNYLNNQDSPSSQQESGEGAGNAPREGLSRLTMIPSALSLFWPTGRGLYPWPSQAAVPGGGKSPWKIFLTIYWHIGILANN